jgi:hypothetical protein
MGLWFIPVIAAGYAVKKIFDASTSSSSSSSSPSLGDKIESGQKRRAEVRRERLQELINGKHSEAFSCIEEIAGREAKEIGRIQYEKTFYGANIECVGANIALSSIKMQMPGHSRGYSKTMDSQSIHLDSINICLDDILQRADSKYGPMAGFNNVDVYHKSLDPFLKYLDDISPRVK